MDKRDLAAHQQLLASFETFRFTVGVGDRLVSLMAHYALSHKPSVPDLLIAATALEFGTALWTLNTKDFQFIEGVELVATH